MQTVNFDRIQKAKQWTQLSQSLNDEALIIIRTIEPLYYSRGFWRAFIVRSSFWLQGGGFKLQKKKKKFASC